MIQKKIRPDYQSYLHMNILEESFILKANKLDYVLVPTKKKQKCKAVIVYLNQGRYFLRTANWTITGTA